MSTHALSTSEPTAAAPSGRSLLPYADLVALALALPLFIAAGWPLAGYGACAAVWVAQRALQGLILRRLTGSDDPKAAVGLLGASMMIRIWLLAGAILVVGLSAGKDAGLAAAILAVVLFQVHLMALMLEKVGTKTSR